MIAGTSPALALDRGTLRWSAGPVSFELFSAHSAVLERARDVLRPWLKESPGGRPPDARFLIERVAGPGSGWRVERCGSGEQTIADSLDLALAAVEYGAAAVVVAAGSGIVSLHAALVSRGGRGALLVGPKESGKSTLACALLRTGWRLHSDDTAVVEDGGCVRGISRRVSLRATSRALLERGTWERIAGLPGSTTMRNGVLFHPSEAWPGETPEGVEPAAVVFLARRGATAGRAELVPLDAGRALLALALYCNRREAGFGCALEALQPLVDGVRAFDLGRGDLATMVGRVGEATAS